MGVFVSAFGCGDEFLLLDRGKLSFRCVHERKGTRYSIALLGGRVHDLVVPAALGRAFGAYRVDGGTKNRPGRAGTTGLSHSHLHRSGVNRHADDGIDAERVEALDFFRCGNSSSSDELLAGGLPNFIKRGDGEPLH